MILINRILAKLYYKANTFDINNKKYLNRYFN